MARKKLNELAQIHGKQENDFVPTTLEQLWGYDGLDKYKTLDKEVYSSQLAEMNTADLRTEAVRIGVVPISNRERLLKRLLSEFSKHVASFQRPNSPAPDKKPSKAVLKIMAEVK
jgi:hypothetical protein